MRFFFGAAASGGSPFASAAPRSGSGAWIKTGVSAGSPFSLASALAAAGFFFRFLPPREPRRVLLRFGCSSPAGFVSVSTSATPYTGSAS